MGTIQARKRKGGSTGYTAMVRLKRDGKIVHAETQTFSVKSEAKAWITRREAALAQPGGIDAAKVGDPTFGEAIDRFIATRSTMGSTKTQVLRSLKAMPIAAMRCREILAHHWSEMAQAINALPQTRANYLSHASAVVAVAKPLWGFDLDPSQLKMAQVALRSQGLTAKGGKRTRRPSVEEMTRIVDHFVSRKARVPWSSPMAEIAVFALFSARRQDEVLRIRWDDLDVDHSRVLVRDMKSPGGSKGNHVWCDLPPEALRIVQAMPRADARIFPFGRDGVTMSFVRAIRFLEIDDLHFHDLRHEGVSRLFEMGRTIPQVSAVSGHQSWASLQRYAHLRQTGDKWAGWPWVDRLAIPLDRRGFADLPPARYQP